MNAVRKVEVGLTVLLSLFFLVGKTLHAYAPYVVETLQTYNGIHKVGTPINASGADLRGAYLPKGNFAGANFSLIQGQKCKVTSRNKNNPYSICNPSAATNLAKSNLSGANLFSSNWTEANFAYADLSHANLSQASFKKANFAHADLTGATVLATDFQEANFTGAKGLQTLQDKKPGKTSFCKAKMPDGTICSPGMTWKNSVPCNCSSDNKSK